MSVNWLPWPTQRLHAALESEATWGYMIYRTTYTSQSDTAFPRFIDLLNTCIKDQLFSEYALAQKNKSERAEPTPYLEIWARHRPIIMTDPAQFDEASIDSIRAHFESWVVLQEKRDHPTMYRTCILYDEESQQAFLDASLQEENNESRKKEIHPIHYVKLITALSESDDDEYDGFMGGERSDRNGIDPIPHRKEIAALSESDDDDYDGFLGGYI